MERLTKKSETGMVWFIDHEKDDMRLEPCEMDSHHSRLAIQKLAEYEDLDEQGKLVKLPCNVEDMVYIIEDDCEYSDGDCYTKRMCKTCYYRNIHIENAVLATEYEILSRLEEFGKTVFLTKSEAEAKLEELRGEEDGRQIFIQGKES